MKILRPYANPEKENSFSVKWRRKRFVLFKQLLSSLTPPVKVLDVGGTEYFWENVNFIPESNTSIVLLNLYKIDVTLPWISSVVGNGMDLSRYNDGEFDLVFSNSVIEHLGTWENQLKMASEVRRVGKHYFVQTPNRYFPVKPHFLFPFFHFLPYSCRVWIVRNFNTGWFDKTPDRSIAEAIVKEIRLLSKNELKYLFPESTIFSEKVLGMTKSFVAWK